MNATSRYPKCMQINILLSQNDTYIIHIAQPSEVLRTSATQGYQIYLFTSKTGTLTKYTVHKDWQSSIAAEPTSFTKAALITGCLYFITPRYSTWCGSFYFSGHSFYKTEYAQEKEKDGLEGNFWAEHALATVDYACRKCHTAECRKGLVMAPATCLLSRLPSTSSPPLSFLFCHSKSRCVWYSRNDITKKMRTANDCIITLLAFVSYDSKKTCLFDGDGEQMCQWASV